MATTQTISSCLWFDRQAEEAVKFYTGIFKNSKVGKMSRYGKEGFEMHHMPEGTILAIHFWLNDHEFIALNGGPIFKFNEAVSLVVNCDTQEEIDYYWEKLTEGGDKNAQQCGWLKDKFGLSWQVSPTVLPEMLADSDKQKTESVMKAMMQMKKINIAGLEKAYKGEKAGAM